MKAVWGSILWALVQLSAYAGWAWGVLKDVLPKFRLLRGAA